MNLPEWKHTLERILENISNIETLLETTTEESFLNDLKDYNAICLEFIQIGEKVNQIPESVYEQYPDIPWHELYGLRNRIVHGYEKVKKRIVWATIVQDLPNIKKQIESILSQ
ncbi:MAG: DUF86 domain-containing protein [Bacteroidales bacterium]|nr:DUF86 domain-containing protein [Bacteroidales bacterium]MBQ9702088.1 DUF86 domain-containing protein [Bacteroidales bacterium]MBR1782252.1 DUF86 domain-containing protein [Bacteroidales bacterium]